MDQVINIDAKTLDMCTKKIANIGETIYRNICGGTEVVVPWGSMDWVSALGFGLLGAILVLLCFGVAAMLAIVVKGR